MSRVTPCEGCGKPSVILLYRCALCAECREQADELHARWMAERKSDIQTRRGAVLTTARERLSKIVATHARFRGDLTPIVAADLTPLLSRSIDFERAKREPHVTVTPRLSAPEWAATLGAIEFAANQFEEGNEVRSVLLNARAELLLARGRTNR